MAVAAAAAATASFSGLRGLALLTGWPGYLAWLLPLTLDAYAMTSARVWLARAASTRIGRRFAQCNAIGAILASVAGNAAFHTISVGLIVVTWPIVVAVGAVPAAILGLIAHLHALQALGPDPSPPTPGTDPPAQPGDQSRSRTADGPADEAAGPDATDRPPTTRTDDELMPAARAADAEYRATHDGRPITRDALRTVLRIAGPRASALRRQLAAEAAGTHEQQPQPKGGTTTA